MLRQRFIIVTVIATVIGVPACGRSSGDEPPPRPASVEHIAGSDVARVTLTSDAARRLDVRTTPVRELRPVRDLEPRSTIPYDAVLYDASGNTWVYSSPQPLVYIRVPIDVIRIVGNQAVLSSGPAIGTEVVTVGTSELWGAEYKVGGE